MRDDIVGICCDPQARACECVGKAMTQSMCRESVGFLEVNVDGAARLIPKRTLHAVFFFFLVSTLSGGGGAASF